MALAWLDELGASPSRTLALAAGSFCVGIILGPLIGFLGTDGAAFAVLFLAVPLLFLRGSKAMAGTLICAGLALGIARSLIPVTIAMPIPMFVTGIRDSIVNLLNALAPEPFSSFLSGLIFGGQSGLPHALQNGFRLTGTSHILSASGFNVSILSFVFLNWIIATPVGRKRGIALSFVLLVAYVFAAGATPSVVRAGVMASMLLVGLTVRRRSSALNVLLLAAALMLAFDPTVVADVGFQLSFVATAALLFGSAPFENISSFLPEAFGIRESFAASLAANLATIPIILWHFGTVSLIAPLANLLILPLVPYAMAGTFVGLVAGALDVTLGRFVMLPAEAFASLMLHATVWLEAVPYASVSVPAAQMVAVVSGVISLTVFVWLCKLPAAARK